MKTFKAIFDDSNSFFSKFQKIKTDNKNSKIEFEGESLIQHNNLIEARYRLSLQEKRIILWLLTQIKPDDEDFKLHRLEITKFAELINVTVNNRYSELRKITKRLIQKAIEIYNPQAQEFIQVSWLSSARYQTKEGRVLLEFSPQLKPYLLQLKSHFTKLNLSDMMQLNSIYTIRFYELLKQYQSIGKRTISMRDIREYCGIAEGEYKKYNNFKKDILERVKKEINEKADIIVDYGELKESRKIVAIEWTIHKKDLAEQKHLEQIERLDKELRSKQIILDGLLEYGFSKIMAKRLITLHDEVIVKNAIKAVDLQVARGKAKNPKAMLKVAIEEQWHPEIFKVRQKL